MRYAKFAFVAIVVALFSLVGGSGVNDTQAHTPVDAPPHPANIRAADGTHAGEVTVSWDAVAGVTSYRVGWLADADYRSYPDTWRYYFAYSDVNANSSWTLRRLTPGLKYHFIVGRNYGTAGEVSWPSGGEWSPLTLRLIPAIGSDVPAPALPLPQAPIGGDYDADDDGLIEIRTLGQLDAIRYDLGGTGVTPVPQYRAAFPGAADGMGCPADCTGYELANSLNFDANANDVADAGDPYWNSGDGWQPIGGYYQGDFDGNGHTIANLYINRAGWQGVGLFAGIGYNGEIRNLNLTAVNVTGRQDVGALVGLNTGIVTRSSAAGDVLGTEDTIGGLVGDNTDGSISDSHAGGTVTGGDRVGGLVGDNYNGIITRSYATGDVSGTYYVGALVGVHPGTIINSQGTGSVTGN